MTGDRNSKDREIEERVFRILHEGLFEYLIDRNYAEVPDTFVPSARFVAVANDNLLSLSHPHGRKVRPRRARRWLERDHKDQSLSSIIGNDERVLIARQYGEDWDRWGETWGIERTDGVHQVLAFRCGPTPIFCFSPRAAMALAERCYPNPRPEAKVLCWIPIAA